MTPPDTLPVVLRTIAELWREYAGDSKFAELCEARATAASVSPAEGVERHEPSCPHLVYGPSFLCRCEEIRKPISPTTGAQAGETLLPCPRHDENCAVNDTDLDIPAICSCGAYERYQPNTAGWFEKPSAVMRHGKLWATGLAYVYLPDGYYVSGRLIAAGKAVLASIDSIEFRRKVEALKAKAHTKGDE